MLKWSLVALVNGVHFEHDELFHTNTKQNYFDSDNTTVTDCKNQSRQKTERLKLSTTYKIQTDMTDLSLEGTAEVSIR